MLLAAWWLHHFSPLNRVHPYFMMSSQEVIRGKQKKSYFRFFTKYYCGANIVAVFPDTGVTGMKGNK